MKSMVKAMLRSLWRLSAPARRPLVRKFDEHALELLGRIPTPPGPPPDLDLVLNGVIRELARLQARVELLQQQIEEMQSIDPDEARSEGHLSVVAEVG